MTYFSLPPLWIWQNILVLSGRSEKELGHCLFKVYPTDFSMVHITYPILMAAADKKEPHHVSPRCFITGTLCLHTSNKCPFM